jgi:hypothetical protein
MKPIMIDQMMCNMRLMLSRWRAQNPSFSHR